jgi:3-oxoacyl-(acyl-carrier-protein) synthase
METIVRGDADIMLGAGTEAPLLPLAFAGFGQMRGAGDAARP